MKCIIGLGNPGKKYEKTRHNIGFMVIDELARRHSFSLNDDKFGAKFTTEQIGGNRLMLVKPESFMNLSGEAIRPLMEYYKIPVNDIVVIYDDLDLPTGRIRLREKGGHGGHNGIRSAIDHLKTKDFKRIRLGIGRPPGKMPVVDYVLGRFTNDEMDDVLQSVNDAADAVESWLDKQFVDVMNDFN